MRLLFDFASEVGVTMAARATGCVELLEFPGTDGPAATVNTTPVEV